MQSEKKYQDNKDAKDQKHQSGNKTKSKSNNENGNNAGKENLNTSENNEVTLIKEEQQIADNQWQMAPDSNLEITAETTEGVKRKRFKLFGVDSSDDESITENRFAKISKKSDFVLNLILAIVALSCVVPFIFVVIISFSSENSIKMNGYRFIPDEFSLNAYKYILEFGDQIISAYGVTIFVTVVGTVIGVLCVSTYAFAIARRNFAFKKFFTILAFIPMLFSGGMVANYLVVVNMLHLKNSIWALILPLCMNTWYIMVLRTFYKTSVPESLIESAKLDGASELRLFFKIVFPISLPGIATIALFFSLTYWNDWFNALMYIDDQQIVPLQYFLVRMQSSSEFLSQNVMKLGPRFAEAMKLLPKESSRMAAVVLATAPIIFAYPFFQRFFINGLTIGGVKE